MLLFINIYCILKIKTQAILGELPEGVLPTTLLLPLCTTPQSTGGEIRLSTFALASFEPFLIAGSDTTEPADDDCVGGLLLLFVHHLDHLENLGHHKKTWQNLCNSEGLLLYYRNWLINIKTFLL